MSKREQAQRRLARKQKAEKEKKYLDTPEEVKALMERMKMETNFK